MPSKIGPRRPMRETPAGPPQSPRRAPAEPQSWAELGLRRAACRPMRETPAGSLGDHWGITGGSLVTLRVGNPYRVLGHLSLGHWGITGGSLVTLRVGNPAWPLGDHSGITGGSLGDHW